MIRIELGVEDLANTRFGISPLAETVFSLLGAHRPEPPHAAPAVAAGDPGPARPGRQPVCCTRWSGRAASRPIFAATQAVPARLPDAASDEVRRPLRRRAGRCSGNATRDRAARSGARPTRPTRYLTSCRPRRVPDDDATDAGSWARSATRSSAIGNAPWHRAGRRCSSCSKPTRPIVRANWQPVAPACCSPTFTPTYGGATAS